MPVFDGVETAIQRSMRRPPRPLTLRLLFRTAVVAAVTFTAVLLPFFGDLMGLISSVGLMPVTFILPPIMWIVATRPRGRELAVNVAIAGVSSVVALLSLVGSVRNIAVDWQRYRVMD